MSNEVHTEIYFCERCNNAMLELPHACKLKCNVKRIIDDCIKEYGWFDLKIFLDCKEYTPDERKEAIEYCVKNNINWEIY